MKETKKFFDNNRLNKGYSKFSNARNNDAAYLRKRYKHVLPPIDMIEEYEELRPGTFEKLMSMAEKEQNHRHSMDILSIEKYNKAEWFGRISALLFIILVSITTLTLILVANSLVLASVFAVSAFGCIALVSYFHSQAFTKTKSSGQNYNNRIHKNNLSSHSKFKR